MTSSRKHMFAMYIIIVSGYLVMCPASEAFAITNTNRQLLRLHNQFRSLVARGKFGFTVANMKTLKWDLTLAEEAKLISHSCGKMDKTGFQSALDPMGIPLQGINDVLAKKNLSVYRMFLSWVAQKRYYDEDFKYCHWDKPCDMYLQLVSAKTDRIGCSLNTRCGLHQYLVCLYSPGVTEADNKLYSVGDVCTRCPDDTPFCSNGLCVACEDRKTCDCKKTCAKDGVLRGILDHETCSCQCVDGMGPNCDEDCKNPDQYIGYDICHDVTLRECEDVAAGNLLREFCPEQCVCGKVRTDIQVPGV